MPARGATGSRMSGYAWRCLASVTYTRVLRSALSAVMDADPPQDSRLNIKRAMDALDHKVERLWEGGGSPLELDASGTRLILINLRGVATSI